MDFTEYANGWLKSELIQGRIMIVGGIVLLFLSYVIYRGQNELLKGALIPLALLWMVLIGYGGYILYSRPVHVNNSIALYKKSESEGIKAERAKHIKDNNAGNPLLKYVYPSLMLLMVLALFFTKNDYYKGMELGFILLFLIIYCIDYGFVSRSNAFITFLDELAIQTSAK